MGQSSLTHWDLDDKNYFLSRWTPAVGRLKNGDWIWTDTIYQKEPITVHQSQERPNLTRISQLDSMGRLKGQWTQEGEFLFQGELSDGRLLFTKSLGHFRKREILATSLTFQETLKDRWELWYRGNFDVLDIGGNSVFLKSDGQIIRLDGPQQSEVIFRDLWAQWSAWGGPF